jgi:hypothetical protein
MDKNTKTIEEIFTREINRLNALSEAGNLEAEHVSILLSLVKAHASFKAREDKGKDTLDDLSNEELERIASDS